MKTLGRPFAPQSASPSGARGFLQTSSGQGTSTTFKVLQDTRGRLASAMLFGKRNLRDAFEKQAEKVFPSVFGTALRLTRSREEAEDLAQEAIVRAYEAFDRFDEIGRASCRE